MAWYYGTYKCGHEGRVDIVGPGKDREWKKDRAFGGLCPECYIKFKEQERAAANKKAAEESKAMDFPELTGTEKQVAWANTIRMRFANEEYEHINSRCKHLSEDLGKPQEVINDFKIRKTAPVDFIIRTHTDAKFWIDTIRDMTRVECYALARDEYNRHTEEVENLGKSVEESKQDETVTVEPEEKKKEGVAELIIDENTVKAIYHKDDDFRSIVKSKGFEWSGSEWEIGITEYTGTAVDRIADLGNELLNNGFAVQFPDENCKSKAVSGDFALLNSNWIKYNKSRNNLAIEWAGYNNDLYWKAKELPGAKWHGWMEVPVRYYKEVLDFADINGFSISKKANVKIEECKAKEAGFEKVNAVKIEQPETVDKLKEILEKSGTIEDLMDED